MSEFPSKLILTHTLARKYMSQSAQNRFSSSYDKLKNLNEVQMSHKTTSYLPDPKYKLTSTPIGHIY
jgi:hypothetical protein